MIAPASVPELQKLLTIQHLNGGVGVMLVLNDLGRDQPLTLANEEEGRAVRANRAATSSQCLSWPRGRVLRRLEAMFVDLQSFDF